MKSACSAFIGLGWMAASASAWALSADVTFLHSFNPASGGAALPEGSLAAGGDGALFGTSFFGGGGGGSVYKLTPAGSESIVYSFAFSPRPDGAHPEYELVLAPDGKLYGTTSGGGSHESGTFFQVSQSGSFQKLYDFNIDETPVAPLILAADANFYGVADFGGFVFRLSPAGAFQKIYAFGDSGVYQDGIFPHSGLQQAPDGALYGTTAGGGGYGGGVVYRVTPSGDYRIAHRFGDCGSGFGGLLDGGGSRGSLVLGRDGNLYGATYATIFKMTLAGAVTVLYRFGTLPRDGFDGGTLLALPDGSLLGTTAHGGRFATDEESGGGTVFHLSADGLYTQLHSFGGTEQDGWEPLAALTPGKDGAYYGVSSLGGTERQGAFYKLVLKPEGSAPSVHFSPIDCSAPVVSTPASHGGGALGMQALIIFLMGGLVRWGRRRVPTSLLALAVAVPALSPIQARAASAQATVVYNFIGGADAGAPFGLTLGTDGTFYGVSLYGGLYGNGTVFKISMSGSESVLHSFGMATTDGANPSSALIMAADGNFYGLTYFGGSGTSKKGAGTAYKITPGGTFTQLASFGTAWPDGAMPTGQLAVDSTGNVWGVTEQGGGVGQASIGTVVRISPAGGVTQVYAFGWLGASTFLYDAEYPNGLVRGADGNFYGTSRSGGRWNRGAAFRITPDGHETVFHDFGACIGSADYPYQELTIGPDGNFYGVGFDTIFRLSPAGVVTVLYKFETLEKDGYLPGAGLTVMPDGRLLGTTVFGGANYVVGSNKGGTVYRLSPDGTYTQLYSFGASATDGQAPESRVILGPDGNYYGTTVEGGAFGSGTVFRLALNAAGTAPSIHFEPYIAEQKYAGFCKTLSSSSALQASLPLPRLMRDRVAGRLGKKNLSYSTKVR